MDARQTKLHGRIIARFEELKREKQPWNPVFDFVAQYVMMRRGNFASEHANEYDKFTPDTVFDSTAARANFNLSSALIGALFPYGGKTFQIQPPLSLPMEQAQSEEVKNWFEQITLVCQAPFDDFEAGFQVSQEEYFNEQGSYGTSGIGVFEDDENPNNPIYFESIDAKRSWIAEGKRGLVDTLYRVKTFTLHQLEQEYELENLSTATQEKIRNNKIDEKLDVLIAIEPRIDRVHNKEGNDNLPIASVHIDLENHHILRESGYTDPCTFVTRFWKLKGEVWGRSPAITALSDILELNSLTQASIVAVEKFLDPVLVTYENSMLGGGIVDTTAGTVLVAKQMQRNGGRPIEPLFVTGELHYTYDRMDKLADNVDEMFYSDEVTDLNNEHRQTAQEANIRNEMRRLRLSNVYARQITELYVRMIARVFNILLKRNRLGYVKNSKEYNLFKALNDGREPITIPDVIVQLMQAGMDAYRIMFLSPAARILRQEELTGITQLVQMVIEVAPVNAAVVDQVNWDRTFKAMQDLTGATTTILNSTEEVQQIREGRAQQQKQLQDAEAAAQQALTMKHGAQAAEAASKAGIALGAQGNGVGNPATN